MKKLAALLLAVVPAFAQTHKIPTVDVAGALPSGACTVTNALERYNGNLYICDPQTMTWRIISTNFPGVASDGANGLTVAGTVTLGGDPSSNLQAATKQYVDAHAGGVTTTITITQAPYNASGFIAKTTISSNTSAGALTIPVANTTGFSVGHVAIIANGGTSNQKDFAAYISAVGANSITLSTTAVTGNLLPPTAVSGTTGITANITAGWLVYEVGTTTLAANAGIGATQITLTNAASYSVGQGILIFGAGTGGWNSNNLITTITAINGNVLTLANAVTVGVSTGAAVQHDDTAAFQTAVNLASVTSNVKISVPEGYYQINGNLNATTIAPVQFPSLAYYPNSLANWLPMATIEIDGPYPAPEEQSYLVTGYSQPHVSGAIIKSSANSGHGIFVAPNTSGSQFGISNINVIFKNLTFRLYPNPQGPAIYNEKAAQTQIYDCDFDTGETGPTTQPTDATYNAAIRMPTVNNGGNNTIQRVEILGWYYGIWTGEHLHLEQIRLDSLNYPIYINGNAQYEITGTQIYCDGNPHCIYMPSGAGFTQNILLDTINVEHHSSPAWVTSVDDVSDAGNHLVGALTIERQNASQTWTQVGAGNVRITDLGYVQNSQTFSAASSVSLTNWYTPLKSLYRLTCSGLTLSTSADIQIQFSTNGGSSYISTSTYAFYFSYVNLTTGASAGPGAATTAFKFRNASTTLPASGAFSANLTLDEGTSTTFKKLYGNIDFDDATNAFFGLNWHGTFQNTGTVNAIQLAPTVGTFSGTCTMAAI